MSENEAAREGKGSGSKKLNQKEEEAEIKEKSQPLKKTRQKAIPLSDEFIKFNKNEYMEPSPLVSLMLNKSNVVIPNYPWLKDKTKSMQGMIKLHHEIMDFYEFIKPTEEEDEKRNHTFQILYDLLKEHWPELKVKKFGSYPNKLHLPDSDVDIVVLSENKDMDQTKILKKIIQKLLGAELVEYIKLIEARVPIIRATIKGTKINTDIR